jgi:hypothetical protein
MITFIEKVPQGRSGPVLPAWSTREARLFDTEEFKEVRWAVFVFFAAGIFGRGEDLIQDFDRANPEVGIIDCVENTPASAATQTFRKGP